MRLARYLLIAPLSIALASALAFSQATTHTVAITIDDLPFITGDNSRPMTPVDAKAAEQSNRKLLAGLGRHHVPVTGFVIQHGVEALGTDAGTAILREWIKQGFDLGNHSYAHPNFNDLTVPQFEDQVTRGEAAIKPLMASEHRKLQFFRFPYNHTGDTQQKHDALAAFLARRGYRLAPCTIEDSDWLFNATYFLARSRHDQAAIARVRADYLAFAAAQIDYFLKLDQQVLGYDAPHIMLMHDNPLNADVIDDLLDLFEERGFRFVTLSQAESDPIYRQPDPYIAKSAAFGPMWGYRWAVQRGVHVDGSLEPNVPDWIQAYGKH